MNRGESGDHEIANLLGAWRTGDAGEYQKLIPLVYDHLRRIAGGEYQFNYSVKSRLDFPDY